MCVNTLNTVSTNFFGGKPLAEDVMLELQPVWHPGDTCPIMKLRMRKQVSPLSFEKLIYDSIISL